MIDAHLQETQRKKLMVIKFWSQGMPVVLTAVILTGCTNVEPWDRYILAKESMTFMPDPLGAEWREHAQFSREGTQGATGASSGGCGCN